MLNKIKNRFNNKKGFTLVELIVVIVIILILAAVLVPNVTKYVSNAKEASLQSDASAIFTQLQAEYANAVATSAGAKKDYTINGKTVKYTADASPTESIYFKVDSNDVICEFYYSDGTNKCKWTSSDGKWVYNPS